MDIEGEGELARYLSEQGHLAPQETVRVERMSGGVSNRTMFVHRSAGESWVVKQALPRLRVEVRWECDPRRIHREALGMQRLGQLLPPGTVPRLVFEDPEQHLLAMTAVPEPHANWKTLLLTDGPRDEHVRQAAEMLGTIHAAAAEHADRYRKEFGDRTYFEALRLEPYYGYAAEQVAEAADFLTALMDATRRRTLTLVHGDFSPKNILIHDNRLVLLDHEVIHWGDPAFDVGFFLAHLLSKAHHCREHRTAFRQAAVAWWNGYHARVSAAVWADDLEAYAVRHTLACLLARVRGRSQLEYLAPEEKTNQAAAVTRMMDDPPGTITALAEQFVELVSNSSGPADESEG